MNCCSIETEEFNPENVAEVCAFDPVNAPAPRDDPEHKCRSCASASRRVTRKTVLLMLKSQLLDLVHESEYRFCSDADCKVVYFSQNDGVIFRTSDLRVRVGLKETVDPIPLCYCFGFDQKDAREEIDRTGASMIPQRIAALIKQKMCACPFKNPSGACCLGDVNKAIKSLKAEGGP